MRKEFHTFLAKLNAACATIHGDNELKRQFSELLKAADDLQIAAPLFLKISDDSGEAMRNLMQTAIESTYDTSVKMESVSHKAYISSDEILTVIGFDLTQSNKTLFGYVARRLGIRSKIQYGKTLYAMPPRIDEMDKRGFTIDDIWRDTEEK